MPKTRKKKYICVPETPTYYHNSRFELEIRPSMIDGAGLGVFAKNDIPTNSFIDYYTGDICRGLKGGLYFFAINDTLGINAEAYPRCYMGMINSNHGTAYDLNCEFVVDQEKETVAVYSIREILAGNELYVSYGTEYF